MGCGLVGNPGDVSATMEVAARVRCKHLSCELFEE
jgi:hypothetical protein